MIDPASARTVAVQAASASAIEAYPAVREVWVVVLDVTTVAAGQVRVPVAAAARRVCGVLEALAAVVAEAVEEEALVAVDAAAVAAADAVAADEGGNKQ